MAGADDREAFSLGPHPSHENIVNVTHFPVWGMPEELDDLNYPRSSIDSILIDYQVLNSAAEDEAYELLMWDLDDDEAAALEGLYDDFEELYHEETGYFRDVTGSQALSEIIEGAQSQGIDVYRLSDWEDFTEPDQEFREYIIENTEPVEPINNSEDELDNAIRASEKLEGRTAYIASMDGASHIIDKDINDPETVFDLNPNVAHRLLKR